MNARLDSHRLRRGATAFGPEGRRNLGISQAGGSSGGMDWHYERGGKSYGPVPADDLHALIRSGQVTRDTPVWHRGLSGWIAAGSSELGDLFGDRPPPALTDLPGVQPLSNLAQMVRWAVFAYMAVIIVELVIAADFVGQLIDMGPRLLSIELLDYATRTDPTAVDDSPSFGRVLHWVAFTFAGICILLWKYRACKNLHVAHARGMDISPGWAVGSYFVPILNLWLPFQAMSRIARASRNPYHPEVVTRAGPLGWWWFLWLATIFGTVAGSVAIRDALWSASTGPFYVGVVLLIVSDVLEIPLCLTLLSIVRTVTRAQKTGRSLRQGASDT